MQKSEIRIMSLNPDMSYEFVKSIKRVVRDAQKGFSIGAEIRFQNEKWTVYSSVHVKNAYDLYLQ